MPEILLASWNENGCAVLKEMAKAGFPPRAVLLPSGFHFEQLRNLCFSFGVPTREIQAGHRIVDGEDESITLIVSASWPFRISPQDLCSSKFGGINVHSSFLPNYRGVHPLNCALINDEPTIGVTVHEISEVMDGGDILLQQRFPVTDDDDLLSVREKAHSIGGHLVSSIVPEILAGRQKRLPQNEDHVSFALRRFPSDGRIDWKLSARKVFCFVRGNGRPGPGAFACLGEKVLYIWKCKQIDSRDTGACPGTILSEDPLVISCGFESAISALEFEGFKPMIGQVLE